jgi:hypothetical protein
VSSIARKIVYGLRTLGPTYLLRAPIDELANPRLSVTRYVRQAMVGIGRRVGSPDRRRRCWSRLKRSSPPTQKRLDAEAVAIGDLQDGVVMLNQRAVFRW